MTMTTPTYNIILTGMPGSGKSTVGVILAKELGLDFVDTDILIQRGEGVMLQRLLDTRGVEGFLATEERYITDLTCTGTIIAPGGSVVLSDSAMQHLKGLGTVVFLDTPITVITGRIDVYTRGIVKHPEQSLADVLAEREPLFRKYADLTVDCRGMDQVEVAAAIAARPWSHGA